MKSVLNFPDRGPWGKSNWPGNCSGHVQKALIEHFNPTSFVDICEGSGTSRDICAELNIDYVGLDLHSGFDFTKDLLLEKLSSPADMVFSHPPYHDMVRYSTNQDDTSNCLTVTEFLEKSQLMLLNQREGTKSGGVYCTLIGDQIKNGECRSFQSDFIRMMPKNELFRVIIKLQHNMRSNSKSYTGNFLEVIHEYLIIWKRRNANYWQICAEIAFNEETTICSSWRNAIRIVMMRTRKTTLGSIYLEIEKLASNLIKNNPNWKAKVRQILQKYHTQVERGIWSI